MKPRELDIETIIEQALVNPKGLIRYFNNATRNIDFQTVKNKVVKHSPTSFVLYLDRIQQSRKIGNSS